MLPGSTTNLIHASTNLMKYNIHTVPSPIIDAACIKKLIKGPQFINKSNDPDRGTNSLRIFTQERLEIKKCFLA